MNKPQLLYNVAILGSLHHGKTLLSDMLINETLVKKNEGCSQSEKYTDSRLDEITRGVSLKCAPF